MIGFPSWTLWGMCFSALSALIFVGLALIGQSPRLMRRLGLDVYRLDLRVRVYTGYAFACLILIAGFFLAGVPLSSTPEPVAAGASETETTATPTTPVGAMGEISSTPLVTATLPVTVTNGVTSPTRPATGAMGGLSGGRASETPTGTVATRDETVATPMIPTLTPESTTTGEEESANAPPTGTGTPTRVTSPTPSLTPTSTPTPTPSHTPTPTPTATPSPSPTMSPTPIEGETATVDSDGANIWLHRSPGGQMLVLVSHGETLILMPRHANQGGELWQEVKTLQGVDGWLQDRYLVYEEQ